MVINYAKKNYDRFVMDWDSLFDYLNQLNLFASKKIQSEFLFEWKERLIQSEQRSEKQFKSLDLVNTEHFPLRIVIGETFLGWSAVNVDLIEHLIYLDQQVPTIVSNDIFTLESEHLARYQLQPANKVLYQPSHKNCTKIDMPILIFSPIEFSFGPKVIDGNNRVHFAIENDIREIPAYIITEVFFLAHPEIFLDEFCRNLFFFLSDLHYFINNRSSKRLFRKSNKRMEKLFIKNNSLLYIKLS